MPAHSFRPALNLTELRKDNSLEPPQERESRRWGWIVSRKERTNVRSRSWKKKRERENKVMSAIPSRCVSNGGTNVDDNVVTRCVLTPLPLPLSVGVLLLSRRGIERCKDCGKSKTTRGELARNRAVPRTWPPDLCSCRCCRCHRWCGPHASFSAFGTSEVEQDKKKNHASRTNARRNDRTANWIGVILLPMAATAVAAVAQLSCGRMPYCLLPKRTLPPSRSRLNLDQWLPLGGSKARRRPCERMMGNIYGGTNGSTN